jgi:peptide/nickel transport system ATP-binding protein
MIQLNNVSVEYDLKKGLFSKHKFIYPLNQISLKIPKGSIIGIVGESGSGKTTLARALLRLVPIKEGSIELDGEPIHNLAGNELYNYRTKVQAIFQDPYGSLNPRLSIRDILEEGLTLRKNLTHSEIKIKIESILDDVGLSKTILEKFPHEFSGGQRQRIAIARSLLVEPEYIICDEILSALDISTQAQVLNLLLDLKAKKNITYIFITHDINLIKEIADKIAVFYLGNLVETLEKPPFDRTWHPYSQYLFQSSFSIQSRKISKTPLEGEVPSMLNYPKGCVFETRCPFKKSECNLETPKMKIGENGSFLCHFNDPK